MEWNAAGIWRVEKGKDAEELGWISLSSLLSLPNCNADDNDNRKHCFTL